jgi:hypothetical protein
MEQELRQWKSECAVILLTVRQEEVGENSEKDCKDCFSQYQPGSTRALAFLTYTPDFVRQLMAVSFRSSAHPLAAFAH